VLRILNTKSSECSLYIISVHVSFSLSSLLMQLTDRTKGFIFHFLNIYLKDFSILDDANNLLIHHVKRQTSIHKEDKHKIKVLLKHFLMDRFKHPRQEMSEDEREEEDESGKEDAEADSESGKGNSRRKKSAVKDDVSSAKQDDANNFNQFFFNHQKIGSVRINGVKLLKF
jgi:hypothetical protein